MNQKVSTERYMESWNEHIGELTRLGWHLNLEQQEELSEIQSDLRELVKRAAQRKITEEHR